MRLFRRVERETEQEEAPDPQALLEAEIARLRSTESHAATFAGDLRVAGRFASSGSMVIRGSLHVEADGVFDVPARVMGSVTLGVGARTTHPLVIEGDLVMHGGARVPACEVEGTVSLHPGAAIEGSLRCQTLFLEEAVVVRPVHMVIPEEEREGTLTLQ